MSLVVAGIETEPVKEVEDLYNPRKTGQSLEEQV